MTKMFGLLINIINHRKVGGETEYEVKWRGFGYDDTTWEPESNIHDQNLIDVYWRKQAGYYAK